MKMVTILYGWSMVQLSSAAQLGMLVNNQNHQVVFLNIGHFTTNVNLHHVRIPVTLNMILNAPKLALQKIKNQSKIVNKTTIAELKKNGNYKESVSLTRAIVQQSSNTAEEIVAIT